MAIKYKQVSIDIPKGYEYDSATVVNINELNIHFRCNNIDYDDVCNKLKLKNESTIITNNDKLYDNEFNKILKCQAITKLFNIAEYYNKNKDDKYSDKYYYISKTKDSKDNDYIVVQIYSPSPYFPVFIDSNDAKAVIDNPNFKEILDNIFK